MRFLRTPYFWLATALIIAVVAVWCFKNELPSVRLKDGSIVKLEFVGYQRANAVRKRFHWVDTFRATIARSLGRPVFSRQAPTDSLVVWVSRRDEKTGTYKTLPAAVQAAAVDSHGCEFDAIQPMVHTPAGAVGGFPLPTAMGGRLLPTSVGATTLPTPPATAKSTKGNYIITSVVLPTFPRHEKIFKVQFYDGLGGLLAELPVPNPVYRKFPTWKPDPLPITHQAGELTASLVRVTARHFDRGDDPNLGRPLRTAVMPMDPLFSRPGSTIGRFLLVPKFELLVGGKPTLDWELNSLDVEDATGNRPTQNMSGFPNMAFFRDRQAILSRGQSAWGVGRGYEPSVSARVSLCTNESAWKLSAAFFRLPEATFASNEMWFLPNFPIPAPGSAKTVALSNTWQGVTVRLWGIAGPGSVTYSNGIPVNASTFTPLSGQGAGPYPNRSPGGSTTIYSTNGLSARQYAFSSGSRSSIRTSGRSSGGISISEISVDADQPSVVVQVSGPNEDFRFHCVARVGNEERVCDARGTSNEYRLFLLNVPAGTTAVDLTFIVQRPRLMEFLIRPPWATN